MMDFAAAAEELGRDPTFEEMQDRELGLGKDLACRGMDCGCPAFVAVPFTPGTYIPTGLGEDGFEVLSHEPGGQARLCVFERCSIADGEERYRVVIYPDTGGADEAETRDDSLSWHQEYDEEELDDPAIHHAAPVRYVPSISCVKCVVALALVAPDQSD